MKKALIITYYWPPSGGAGVQRWLKFAKYLPEYGWEPIIYTPENPESPANDNSLLKDIPDNITVLKNKIWEPFNIYKIFTGRKTTDKLGSGFLSETETKSNLNEKISLWVRGNLFIPDAKCFWIKPSIKYLEEFLKKNKIDVIISTGPPHSLHLIAKSLKTKFNIPWLADFRDPWTEIDFFDKLNLTSWAIKKHNRLENGVVRNADKVIITGKSWAESLNKKNGIKSIVITNGFDEEDLEKTQLNPTEKFTILHVGSINKDRNHKVFWNALKELVSENQSIRNNLHIQLVGKTDNEVYNSATESGLNEFVSYIPYLEHRSSVALEKNASVLYLPVNNTFNSKGILTGKVFEYLAAKRPILAIGPTDGDLAEIMKNTGAGFISDFNDIDSLKKNILLLFNHFTEGTLEVNPIGIKFYSRKYLTEKLVVELNEITNQQIS